MELNDHTFTTAEFAAQDGPSNYFSSAQAHLGQVKLLLLRTRQVVRGHRARATLDQLTMGCDAAIAALTHLGQGAGGAL